MHTTKQEYRKARGIKAILFAFVSSLSLGLRLGEVSVKPTFAIAILFIILIFLFYKVLGLRFSKRCRICTGIFSACASILMVCSKGFLENDSLSLIFGSDYAFCRAAFIMCGYGIMIYFTMNLLFEYAMPKMFREKGWKEEDAYLFKITKKTCFAAIMIAWIPYFISFYPCNFTSDAKDEIAQFVGDSTNCWSKNSELYSKDAHTLLNNHHPVTYTLLVGAFAKAGMKMGNINLFMFIFVLLQAASLALIYSSTVVFIEKREVPRKVAVVSLLFFMFFPLIPMYAITITKDGLFGGMMLLVTMGLFDLAVSEEELLASGKKKAKILASCIGLTLFRNNGIYILYFLIVILLLVFHKSKRAIKNVAILYGMPILLYSLVLMKVIFPYFHIPQGTARELLSIPMQQISRYVLEYGTEGMEKEDEKAVDQVIDTDGTIVNLAKWYEPRLSDPIKRHYNIHATKAQLKRFFAVWAKLFFRHPGVCVEATFNNTFYLTSWEYDSHLFYNGVAKSGYNYGLHNPEALNGLQNTMAEGISLLADTPGTSWCMSIGAWDWILLALLLYLVYKKCGKELLIGVPLLVNLLISIAGPTIYMRYAIEWIVLVPLFLVMACDVARRRVC